MKKTIVLIISILLITMITYSIKFFPASTSISLKIFFNLLNATVAIIAMKLTGIKLKIDFKNKKQYIIGLIIGISLSLCIIIIPIMFGISIVGTHMEFKWSMLIYKLLFYMLIIGPVEELIFRVYVQDTCMRFFNNKWIGVIISSLLFGAWHLINGSLIQMLLATCIGLIFGFCKYLIKDCKYISLSIAHGIYDFSNVLARMFLI